MVTLRGDSFTSEGNFFTLHLMSRENKSNIEISRANTRARFEQWVNNPECEANILSTVHDVGIEKAAKKLGYESQFKQSAFAVTRGTQFEAGLYKDGASLLIQALKRVKAIAKDIDPNFIDLRLRMNGGKVIKSIEEAMEETLALFDRSANGEVHKLTIVAGPLIRIPKGILLPEATLIIDSLILNPTTDGAVEVTVGEIKIFPDRGGNTDPSQLASARAQAGVYVHGLHMVISALAKHDKLQVRDKGFLVFTWPGSNAPVVRWDEDLRWQAQRAAVGFDQLEQSALKVFDESQMKISEEQLVDLVIQSSKSYNSSCIKFCDLYRHCFDEAVNRGDPVVLGDDAARFFYGMDLSRVSELMNGSTALNERELDLQNQLVADLTLPPILGAS